MHINLLTRAHQKILVFRWLQFVYGIKLNFIGANGLLTREWSEVEELYTS